MSHTTNPDELFRWCAMFCSEDESWPVFKAWAEKFAVTEHGRSVAATMTLGDLREAIVSTSPDERIRALAGLARDEAS